MENLPTDVIQYELGIFLYPYERFKLCRVSSIFDKIFNISSFKLTQNHYKYDCNYYIKHLQQYFHDGTCDLSQNKINKLTKTNLKHLQYFIVFHNQLFFKYNNLLSAPAPLTKLKSSSSSSYTQLPLTKNLKHSNTATQLSNPFLNTLRNFREINLKNCALSFAVNSYIMPFIFGILLCGFNTSKFDHKKTFKLINMKKKSLISDHINIPNKKDQKGLILNLSSNNLTTSHIKLICKSLINRKYRLNINKLDLSINQNINDSAVKLLFKCIAKKCHKLKFLNLAYSNITDLSCNVIYNFYSKKNIFSLNKIDLSYTRISENGLFILDELFEELPIKFINKTKKNNKLKENNNINNKLILPKKTNKKFNINTKSKSHSFQILLKGCHFESISTKNYDHLGAIPKLQTHCNFIKLDNTESI